MGARMCRYHRYTVPRVAPQVIPITVAGYPASTREIYSLPVILAAVSNRRACCRIVAAHEDFGPFPKPSRRLIVRHRNGQAAIIGARRLIHVGRKARANRCANARSSAGSSSG